ncbi:MAG: DedA family protein [Candidatus Wildermuthbacteria bacterium]|nr:DedA family protein [Candidatus Wildermuthbacteria bacterium]
MIQLLEQLLSILSSFVISTIEATSYWGIGFLMALESANIPIPSEVVMPFSGFLVWEEKLTFGLVVLAGALGNLVGSIASYYLGKWGGRPFLERYGRYFFVSRHDLDLADKLFSKYGTITIFASRMLPIVRTFISFPAGMAKMNIWKFSAYTFAGSLLWSIVLTYVGVITGENWHSLEKYFRKFDWLIAAVLIVLGAWWIWRHIRVMKREAYSEKRKL